MITEVALAATNKSIHVEPLSQFPLLIPQQLHASKLDQAFLAS